MSRWECAGEFSFRPVAAAATGVVKLREAICRGAGNHSLDHIHKLRVDDRLGTIEGGVAESCEIETAVTRFSAAC